MVRKFTRKKMSVNHASQRPQLIVYVDTETEGRSIGGKAEGQIHSLKLWTAIYQERRKGQIYRNESVHGFTQDQFWEWIDKKAQAKKTLYIFSHNAGFDATILGLFPRIDSGELLIHHELPERFDENGEAFIPTWEGMILTSGPPFIIEVKTADKLRRIVFICNMNYYNDSIRKLGEMMGLEKLEMPDVFNSDEEWLTYCHRDTEILAKSNNLWLKFLDNHDCGNWKFTISAQANTCWRHRFMKHDVEPCIDDDIRRTEADSHFGGIVDIKFAGKIIDVDNWLESGAARKSTWDRDCLAGPVHVFDVNSLYPYVMANGLFPCRFVRMSRECSVDSLRDALTKFAVVAVVRLENAQNAFPHRIKNDVVLAKGSYWTTLCGPELELALSLGYIAQVGRIQWYERADLFSEYVKYFHDLRLKYRDEGNMPFSRIAKMMMNTLYGKFAQTLSRWTTIPGKMPVKDWGQWYDRLPGEERLIPHRGVGGVLQRMGFGDFATTSFPAISGYITSYARMHMYRLFNVVGEGNYYYSDTDSIHTNNVGKERLVSEMEGKAGELGKLKLLGTYGAANYRGIKNYTLDTKRVVSGVKESAYEMPDGTYRQEIFSNADSAIASGGIDTVTVETQYLSVPASLKYYTRGLDGRCGNLWIQ